jgi:hypothetical protein
MTNLRTKESTLQALEKASRRAPTPEEIKKQRISFIMGSLNKDSHVTKAQIQQMLAKQECVKDGE